MWKLELRLVSQHYLFLVHSCARQQRDNRNVEIKVQASQLEPWTKNPGCQPDALEIKAEASQPELWN